MSSPIIAQLAVDQLKSVVVATPSGAWRHDRSGCLPGPAVYEGGLEFPTFTRSRWRRSGPIVVSRKWSFSGQLDWLVGRLSGTDGAEVSERLSAVQLGPPQIACCPPAAWGVKPIESEAISTYKMRSRSRGQGRTISVARACRSISVSQMIFLI